MSKYDHVLRPFVAMMEKELHANAGKGDRPGWLAMSADTCLLEIFYHLGKLQKAVKKSEGDGIGEYAADVANMCMMLADICGVLALADPVPPTGGDAEVRAAFDAWFIHDRALDPQTDTTLIDGPFEPWRAWKACADQYSAHVTQLQAEVERLTAQKADAVAIVDETDDGLFIEIIYGEDGSPLRRGDKLYTAPSDRSYVSRLAYDALQSELAACQQQLTKARELLRSARASVATHNTSNWSSRLLQGIDAYLSNQSAPADKGGDS